MFQMKYLFYLILFTGWNYFGMFIGVTPFFVTIDLHVIKCILVKDFNYFSERGIYYNERDDPICKYYIIMLRNIDWFNFH